MKECAKNVYNLNLSNTDLKVFGKFDSNLLTGSIKVRPAVHIIHNAIVTGNLKNGQTIIEATSANFGIAIWQLSKLGLDVVALVSRRLIFLYHGKITIWKKSKFYFILPHVMQDIVPL